MNLTSEQTTLILDHVSLMRTNFRSDFSFCGKKLYAYYDHSCSLCPMRIKPGYCLASSDYYEDVREVLASNHPELLL